MSKLVIRSFDKKFSLCDGRAPEGKENDGNLYIGNVVAWYDTFEDAKKAREKEEEK